MLLSIITEASRSFPPFLVHRGRSSGYMINKYIMSPTHPLAVIKKEGLVEDTSRSRRVIAGHLR